MFVKFANTEVHIFKLKQGTIVEFGGDYYHIKHVHRTQDQRILLTLDGNYEDEEVAPIHVTWLET